MAQHRAAVEGPIVFNAADTGVSPAMSRAVAREMDISAVLYPVQLLFAAWRAVQAETSRLILASDDSLEVGSRGRDFVAMNEALGLAEMQDWEATIEATSLATVDAGGAK